MCIVLYKLLEKKEGSFVILKLPCLIVTQTHLHLMKPIPNAQGLPFYSFQDSCPCYELDTLAVLWRHAQYSCSPIYHINMHTCCYFLKYVQAKQLVGSTLLVREEDRPELDEGEFYTRDLLGMRVVLKVCAYYDFM